ncbi:transposase [uncultured Defluviicoccus sp.]|uniref:Transposase n=1 Tax=metagenome TaxID=256318 RepID=A0A380TBB7_9ZZZZ|nr:transposase [uncultured Defluviicoccus sp.]
MTNPFRYFKTSPEIIRLAVMMYVRYPLSLRNVEDLLFERGIDISHETVRYWWNRFGPLCAGEIRKRRVDHRCYSNWRWHLDEVFVRINGELHYLWRAVDHEGEVLEVLVTKRRDRKAALKFLKRMMKRYGRPWSIVTDGLRSYSAATKSIGISERHEWGSGSTIGRRTHTSRFDDERQRWPAFATSRRCRNSPPFTHRSITSSISSVISTGAPSSNRTARLRWPSGTSWPRSLLSGARRTDLSPVSLTTP